MRFCLYHDARRQPTASSTHSNLRRRDLRRLPQRAPAAFGLEHHRFPNAAAGRFVQGVSCAEGARAVARLSAAGPHLRRLLCTVPYGLLTERIGRKRVLILSGADVFAALSWVLALCYWRFASIRWVLMSGVFLFIGGGDVVSSSVMHFMVTDTTDQAERAQIFLYLHAADVISGFFRPAISAALMEKGYTWTVLVLAEGVLFSGTFLLTQFIPKTLSLRDKFFGSPDPTLDPTSSQVAVLSSRRSPSLTPTNIASSFVAGISSLLAPLLSVLASNR